MVTASIERFRWWHVEEVLPLERQLFPAEPWTAHHFWSELGQTSTRHYVVALSEGSVVGYAGLCDYPDEAFVQTMAVGPAQQGRGLGAALLANLLEEAVRRGQTRTLLEVRADNEVAQRLYTRNGFRKTGVRRGYYPGGVDAWVMERATRV
ncbi:MAG: ribosomal protein S18P -alanine acetyltransferase [Frankiales bacterium]|nr:ribosomal protein S18P -alanine acetyltransferase [Frankiales bacterium]